MRPPNVIILLADQWRAQATGYGGDPDVRTPNLDALAGESVNFVNAIAGCPVCTPYRASMLMGQYPLTHGLFVNDVPLEPRGASIAQAFAAAGYARGYIGKWHVNANGRQNPIPPERRLGFQYWKVCECTHDYCHSAYYEGDSTAVRYWDGYDAMAQTRDAADYIGAHAGRTPFFLVVSWGPPHDPYRMAPAEFMRLYDPARIKLRPNVPQHEHAAARAMSAAYYANCSALDACVGMIREALVAAGIADSTVLLFTSDHGDMLRSQGIKACKQSPYDESVRVPFLLRYPPVTGRGGGCCQAVLNAPDLMPTLLGMCGLTVPPSVEGHDFSRAAAGSEDPAGEESLIACYHPFADWRHDRGGREYRGLRTIRHTYVRGLDGPWLLFDDERDPYQLDNLVNRQEYAGLQAELESRLARRLAAARDDFRPGLVYLERWGYDNYVRGARATA